MTPTELDFATLRSLKKNERLTWVNERFPTGASPQWWVAMVEAAETLAAAPLVTPLQPTKEEFELGLSILDLAVETGGLSPCYASYWLLRFTDIALLFEHPIKDLPEELTPDGAARRTLRSFPLTQVQALAAAAKRRSDIASGIDQPPDDEAKKLMELEWTMPALERVQGQIQNAGVATEVRGWINLSAELDMDEE